MGSDPVFPARAGMIPDLGDEPMPGLRIPRESGDDPAEATALGALYGYSPRERG